MSTKSTAVPWTDLNERQQAYLMTIYQHDQAAEANERAKWQQIVRRRPADEWRWLCYGEGGYGPSPLKREFECQQLVDQGTGSTFESLRSRSLILVRSTHSTQRGDLSTVHVRMTPAGRKLVRAATGEVREKRQPAGTLKVWHWRALVDLYRSGGLHTEGWGGDYFALDDEAHDWQKRTTWETVRRLETYKWGALVHEVREGFDMRYALTPFGRAYYIREYERYRQLYPELDAPSPSSSKES